MTEPVQNLVESLREELKQYGELLALLDVQQEQVIQRQAAALCQTVSAIAAQGQVIHAARREREQRMRSLAQHLKQGNDISITALIPLLPEAYRPLVDALLQENNHLLLRVQQRARQNHLLLNRSLEMIQQFLDSLCGVGTPVYDSSGARAEFSSPSRTLYEAIG